MPGSEKMVSQENFSGTTHQEADLIIKKGMSPELAKEQLEWCKERLTALENTTAELKFMADTWHCYRVS